MALANTPFLPFPSQLLNVHPGARLCSQRELQQTSLLRDMNFEQVLAKRVTPQFRPPKDHLNCDPSLELEEMIVEAKPLHKKKKRLAKQRSIQRDTDMEPTFIKEFMVYNRYKEVHRREMERKELDWEQELETAMANSEVSGSLRTVQEDSSSGSKGRGERVEKRDGEQEGNAEGPIRGVLAVDDCEGSGCTSGGHGGSRGGTLIDFIDRTPSPRPST